MSNKDKNWPTSMDLRMRGYAARLVKDGITVNVVAPSLNETEMMPDARVDAGARWADPREVAQATVMMLINAYMTGQTIQLNGRLARGGR